MTSVFLMLKGALLLLLLLLPWLLLGLILRVFL